MKKELKQTEIPFGKVVNSETGELLPRIKTQLTAHLYEQQYEVNNSKSQTVPNQSMTIRDMIARHRKGLPIDQAKGALYTGGDDLVQDLDKMDLIDRQNYIDSVADALVEAKARLAESAKTKAEKEFLDKVETEIKVRLQKINETTKKTFEENDSSKS